MQRSIRKTHAERTDISDAKMLESAIDLIVAKGTDKTTLKDVGELAGYSRSMAGYRFGNKNGLFEFILRAVGEEWLSSLKRATKNKNGLQAISSALQEHCKICLNAPKHIQAFYILWFESIGVQSPIKDTVASIQNRRRRDVMNWIEQSDYHGDLSALELADQFNASVLGIAYYWLANPKDVSSIKNLHNNLIITMQKHFA